MASNKTLQVGPTAIPTSTATFYAPPSLTGGTPADTSAAFTIFRHIRVVNRTAGALSFGMYLDTVANGNNTEKQVIAGAVTATPATPATAYASGGISVAAGSAFDWYGLLRVPVGQFLTQVASAAGLVTNAEGEIGIV